MSHQVLRWHTSHVMLQNSGPLFTTNSKTSIVVLFNNRKGKYINSSQLRRWDGDKLTKACLIKNCFSETCLVNVWRQVPSISIHETDLRRRLEMTCPYYYNWFFHSLWGSYWRSCWAVLQCVCSSQSSNHCFDVCRGSYEWAFISSSSSSSKLTLNQKCKCFFFFFICIYGIEFIVYQ